MALTKYLPATSIHPGTLLRNLTGEDAWIVANGKIRTEIDHSKRGGIVASFWEGKWWDQDGWIDTDKVELVESPEVWASYCAWRLTQ